MNSRGRSLQHPIERVHDGARLLTELAALPLKPWMTRAHHLVRGIAELTSSSSWVCARTPDAGDDPMSSVKPGSALETWRPTHPSRLVARHMVGLACDNRDTRFADPGLFLFAIGRDEESPVYRDDEAELFLIVMEEFYNAANAPITAQKSTLSPRQRDVLACLLEGQTAKETAKTLGLAEYTVRCYIKSLYSAVGVSTRAELCRRFYA